MKKGLRIRGFTLIEMLVVLSIIGVLLGISLPAFSRLMAGQGVAGGARQIGGMLSLARAYSIGNNCYSAVIIPGGSSSTAFSGTSSTKFNFCTYRPCVVMPVYKTDGTIDDNKWKFLEWVPDSKWDSIPDGVIITNTNGSELGGATPTPTNVVTNGATVNVASTDTAFFRDTDETASNMTFSAVVFRPSGIPSVSNSSDAYYYVRAGTPNGSSIIKTDATYKNNYKITINQYTGRLKYEQGQ